MINLRKADFRSLVETDRMNRRVNNIYWHVTHMCRDAFTLSLRWGSFKLKHRVRLKVNRIRRDYKNITFIDYATIKSLNRKLDKIE